MLQRSQSNLLHSALGCIIGGVLIGISIGCYSRQQYRYHISSKTIMSGQPKSNHHIPADSVGCFACLSLAFPLNAPRLCPSYSGRSSRWRRVRGGRSCARSPSTSSPSRASCGRSTSSSTERRTRSDKVSALRTHVGRSVRPSVRPRFESICDSFTRSSASPQRNYSAWDFVRLRLESAWV